MHSHNQSMLSKLGFADPDKRLALHDLACQYLGEEENANRLIERVVVPHFPESESSNKWTHEGFQFVVKLKSFEEFRQTRSSLERAISKGDGQYRTTVGFLDLGISFKYTMVLSGEKTKEHSRAKPKPFTQRDTYPTGGIAVEVKISPVSVAEILRQINLYREYQAGVYAAIQIQLGYDRPIYWVCATDFDVSERDTKTLAEAMIHHVRLGPRFKEWARTVDKSKSAATIEI